MYKGFTTFNFLYICVASDGSLWTPVIRPISVPVVSQRTLAPAGSDIRDSRADQHQMLPPEARRVAEPYSRSLPRGTTGMNGPTLEDGVRSAGRPRSMENVDLRTARLPPDQSPMHIPSDSYAEDRAARLSPLKYPPADSHRSLPRSLGHGRPPSTWSTPEDWPHQQQDQLLPQVDRDRSRSMSSDKRKYFPPVQQDRSSQRDETGRQLENTRREVRVVVMCYYGIL